MQSNFFFNDTATTEIYTLSLHDALPILGSGDGTDLSHLHAPGVVHGRSQERRQPGGERLGEDRKSTRLNSSHANISYAVFCLKKKKLCILTLSTYRLIAIALRI